MCTAVTYNAADCLFGRNLDLEYSYNESVVITPRNFPLKFRRTEALCTHFAVIGTAIIKDSYPLYYDAMNEKGLACAALNFPQYAAYLPPQKNKTNLASFELMQWIMAQCSSVYDIKNRLCGINITDDVFSSAFPLTPLHWIFADKHASITAEPLPGGIKVYDNPVGVLTNSPTFDIQMFNLNNYIGLSAKNPENTFTNTLPLSAYSRGMGGLGLPGDLSSVSRFVRTVFTKLNATKVETEAESISQFFHILAAAEHTKGCVKVDGKDEITVYTSCMNLCRGIYLYTTYSNQSITAVQLFNENLDSSRLISYPFLRTQKITLQNSV